MYCMIIEIRQTLGSKFRQLGIDVVEETVALEGNFVLTQLEPLLFDLFLPLAHLVHEVDDQLVANARMIRIPAVVTRVNETIIDRPLFCSNNSPFIRPSLPHSDHLGFLPLASVEQLDWKLD
jgi:hypothetical protein